MKAVIAFVCLALLQISQSFPVDDPPCKALFKDEVSTMKSAMTKGFFKVSTKGIRVMSLRLLVKHNALELPVYLSSAKLLGNIGKFREKKIFYRPSNI